MQFYMCCTDKYDLSAEMLWTVPTYWDVFMSILNLVTECILATQSSSQHVLSVFLSIHSVSLHLLHVFLSTLSVFCLCAFHNYSFPSQVRGLQKIVSGFNTLHVVVGPVLASNTHILIINCMELTIYTQKKLAFEINSLWAITVLIRNSSKLCTFLYE